jgi:hypothetical protein
VSDGGPDPRDKPLGCGVTVTDWRLYTADHRPLHGGGNQTAQELRDLGGLGRIRDAGSQREVQVFKFQMI